MAFRPQWRHQRVSFLPRTMWAVAQTITAVGLAAGAVATSHAAITWDAQGGTHWWFDETNWNADGNANDLLPPSDNGGAASQDTQINIGTGAWDQGEGVVYDPSADPNFASAGALPFPSGYGPQVIDQLNISRDTTLTNLLTIKGDLDLLANLTIGRSSGVAGMATTGILVQKAGVVRLNHDSVDVGMSDLANPGFGHGTYDYRGGILEVAQESGIGIRLSNGTTAGPGGRGRFIMHNPASGGYVRTHDFNVVAFGGAGANNPDGINTGVGIVEFHFENGRTRPIQVDRDLIINNGLDEDGMGVRSARLELVLNAAPSVNGSGVPQNLGLFDVDFDDDPELSGIIGVGSLGTVFSNASATAQYTEGSMLSAVFGNTTYRWTISYTGNITWSDVSNSVVASIAGAGSGTDVVLMGHSSVAAPVNDADFDNDGDVDGEDFLTWQRGLGGPGNNAAGDTDGNGVVNAADLTVWKNQFAPAASILATPEPASAWLALAALTVVRTNNNRQWTRRLVR